MRKYYIFLILIFGFDFVDLHGQEVRTPESIVNEFKDNLASSSGSDTLDLYISTIEYLIKRGNFLQADSILVRSEQGFINLGDSAVLAQIYKERAFMYKVQRRFGKSLEDYLWLKNYYEQRDNFPKLIEVYCLLAEYYRAIGQYDLCLKHLNEAKVLFTDYPPSNEQLAYWYSRKAAWSSESLHNRDSVLYYANAGLEVVRQSNDNYTYALLLNELGFAAMNNHDDRATVLGYYNQAIEVLFENERYRDYVEVVNNIGIYNYRNGYMREGIELLESIVKIQEENDWYGPLQVTYEYLTGLYRDTGLKDASIEVWEKALLANIKNIQTIHAIRENDLALRYENDLAEKEVEVQAQRAQLAEAQALSNKKAFIVTLSIAIALLIITVIAIKINSKFRKQNSQLSQQRDEIESSNQQLEDSLNHQKTLYKELNHRVKNNLAVLTGLIYLQEVREKNDDFKSTLHDLRDRIKSMALVHENLYNLESNEQIDFHEFLIQLFEELNKGLSNDLHIETKISSEDFKLDLFQAIPLAMTINELYTNSIKHAFPKTSSGIIEVGAKVLKDKTIIEYKDDGIGLSDAEMSNNTLGFKLINLLLKQLKGSIKKLESQVGVHFELTIPRNESSEVI